MIVRDWNCPGVGFRYVTRLQVFLSFLKRAHRRHYRTRRGSHERNPRRMSAGKSRSRPALGDRVLRYRGWPMAAPGHRRREVAPEKGAREPRRGSAVKHRPADVVPQPLILEYELAYRPRQLITLPAALEEPCCLALAFWSCCTCGLDRVGGCTELVCGHVCDGPGLASSVGGIPCWPSQISGRAHGMAARRPRPHHRDLAPHPGAGVLDRLPRSRILRLSRLEKVKDVLRARCRPKSEQMMIGVSEGSAAADRHEARVPDLRQDHGRPLLLLAVRQRPRPRTVSCRILDRYRRRDIRAGMLSHESRSKNLRPDTHCILHERLSRCSRH